MKVITLSIVVLMGFFLIACSSPVTEEETTSVEITPPKTTSTNNVEFASFHDDFREIFDQQLQPIEALSNENVNYYMSNKKEVVIIHLLEEDRYVSNYQEFFSYIIGHAEGELRYELENYAINPEFYENGKNQRADIYFDEIGNTEPKYLETLAILLKDNFHEINAPHFLKWTHVYCAPNILIKIRTLSEHKYNRLTYRGPYDGLQKMAREHATGLDTGINGDDVTTNIFTFIEKLCPEQGTAYAADFEPGHEVSTISLIEVEEEA